MHPLDGIVLAQMHPLDGIVIAHLRTLNAVVISHILQTPSSDLRYLRLSLKGDLLDAGATAPLVSSF